MSALYRPQFWIDLEEGVSYLAAAASVEVATRWHDAVHRTAEMLIAQPDLGRLRRDLPQPEIRTLRVSHFGRYLIFYRVAGEDVEFLRVKHGMMNLPSLFPSIKP